MPKAITETELRSLCRAYTRAGVQTAGSIMCREDAHPMARLKAFELLMDRGWGKSAQFIEHSSNAKGINEIKLVIINAPQNEPRIIEQSNIDPNSASASAGSTLQIENNAQVEHKQDDTELEPVLIDASVKA